MDELTPEQVIAQKTAERAGWQRRVTQLREWIAEHLPGEYSAEDQASIQAKLVDAEARLQELDDYLTSGFRVGPRPRSHQEQRSRLLAQ